MLDGSPGAVNPSNCIDATRRAMALTCAEGIRFQRTAEPLLPNNHFGVARGCVACCSKGFH